MQSPASGLDVAQLEAEISKTYTAVSREPDRDFIFPTGRAWAEDLDDPAGQPPFRFIAGADALAQAEAKLAERQQQIAAFRDLSSSLAFDEAAVGG